MECISVLIAAKNGASRTLLESCLVEWGYQTTSVADGEAAQELLQRTHFDICILDWEMPGISGFEIRQQLRSSTAKDVPLVILVASQAQLEEVLEDAQHRNEASANGYIVEPFDLKQLRHRLAGLAQIILLRRDVRAESIKKINWTDDPVGS